MKVTSEEIINVGDVSTTGYLRLDALFNIFQDMAVLHTHKVGFELNDLLGAGKIWVLNRVVVQISQLPRFEETIDIHTWSRKIVRFKGLRDFEMYSQGRSIIRASSLWVFVDINKGRPIRVPAEYENMYGIVQDRSTDVDVEAIKFEEISNPDYSLKVATRVSDYDINGHVNNAVVLQYIETGIVRFFSGKNVIDEIQLMFLKEIPLQVDEVTLLLQKRPHGCLFEIENNGVVFVRGAVSIGDSMNPSDSC